MKRKKGWRLTEDLRLTLKYELGRVAVYQLALKANCIVKEKSFEAEKKQCLVFCGIEEINQPKILSAELAWQIKLQNVEFMCRVFSLTLLLRKPALYQMLTLLVVSQPVITITALELEFPPQEVKCLEEKRERLPLINVPLLLTNKIQKTPLLLPCHPIYNQRLILKIPLSREFEGWGFFSREEIYLFFFFLAAQHKLSLGEAELVAVFDKIPLNLVVKIWLENEYKLRIFLQQLFIKPKMVYLIVGRLKKDKRLIQTVVLAKEVERLYKI